MAGRSKLWIGLVIATSTAIVTAAVLVLLLWYLQPFQPPNSQMVLHRLQQEQVLDLLREVGRRKLAGESVQQDQLQRLQRAGIHSVQVVRRNESARAVMFECGGADNHYGLLVTAEAGAPNIGYALTPLEEDLWYYSEVPPRR